MPEHSLIERRIEMISEVMRARQLDHLLVYGAGVVGQYGLVQSLTGHFPSHKGAFAVLSAGHGVRLVAGNPVEAAALERDLGVSGAVVVADSGSRDSLFGRVGRLCDELAGGRSTLAVAVGGGRGLAYPDTVLLQSELGDRFRGDVSADVYAALAVKQTEEIAGLRASATIAEHALSVFAGSARAGMTEREAAVVLHTEVARAGVEASLIHVGSGYFYGQHPSDAVIRADLPLTVFVEVASLDGYWSEVGAIFDPGRLSPIARELADGCIDALTAWAGDAVAPLSFGELHSRGAQLMSRGGAATIGYGHGVGLDDQPPAVAAGSAEPLVEGMAVALHPSSTSADGQLAVATANTFVVESGRLAPLSSAPYSVRTLTAP